MTNKNKPVILVVDDDPNGEENSLDGLKPFAKVDVLGPSEVTEQYVEAADLVLVDLKLDDWEQRGASDSLALQPLDGLAVAAILRGHSVKLRVNATSPTAFALRSGRLVEICPALPSEQRAHVLAASLNLEWVFPKFVTDGAEQLSCQIRSLADAVTCLPPSWPIDSPDATRALTEQFLRLPDLSWRTQAWEDIEKCHPPIHELVTNTHGLAFLRWFLQRILPYPCFLIDSRHLAARLRVTHASFSSALHDGAMAEFLKPSTYCGALDWFLGRRWWTAGVETSLWDATNGNSFDPSAVQSYLTKELGVSLIPCGLRDPVVSLDEDLSPIDECISIDDAVRIYPDDWPSYADQAWTSLDLAKKSKMLASLMTSAERKELIGN